MKFKYLVIAFSIIIVLILFTTALLSFVFADSLSVTNLRYLTLPVFFFMVVILISLGIFLLFNYRLFLLLEREDWPALAYYLEQKVLVKDRFSTRNVRLLASSYMVISDHSSVLKLEIRTALAKPSVVEKNVLIFGAARVLNGNFAEAAAFFKTYLDKSGIKAKDKEWVRWFYGFSHLLSGSFSQAEPEFLYLAASSRDAIITGLSSYFLFSTLSKHSLKPQECSAAAEGGKKRVTDALKNAGGWKREVDKLTAEIHIAIIRKYIEETDNWLFKGR